MFKGMRHINFALHEDTIALLNCKFFDRAADFKLKNIVKRIQKLVSVLTLWEGEDF